MLFTICFYATSIFVIKNLATGFYQAMPPHLKPRFSLHQVHNRLLR